MDVLPPLCLLTLCVQYLKRPEESIGSSGTGIIGSFELLADMWIFRTESMSSERVASVLNFRAISSAPNPPFLN